MLGFIAELAKVNLLKRKKIIKKKIPLFLNFIRASTIIALFDKIIMQVV